MNLKSNQNQNIFLANVFMKLTNAKIFCEK